MDPAQVAVATITWVRSAAEEDTLARSLARLAEAGLPVAVADRGTSPRFSDRLAAFPGFSVTTVSEPGLVAQARAAIHRAAAFDRRFILYTEPDKQFFFGAPLRDFLRDAEHARDTGVVLASRSHESFATFPPMQRYTEGVINQLTGGLIGCAGDYSYGPFLMDRKLLPCVAAMEPRLGWGWRHFVFLAAHRRGLRVSHVTGDFPCPPEDREESDGDRVHRLRQLSENVLGLIA
jgi:hypothetical protein